MCFNAIPFRYKLKLVTEWDEEYPTQESFTHDLKKEKHWNKKVGIVKYYPLKLLLKNDVKQKGPGPKFIKHL